MDGLRRNLASVLTLAMVTAACRSPTPPTPPVDQYPNGPKISCPAPPPPLTSPNGLAMPVQYGTPIGTGGAPALAVSCTPPSGAIFLIGSTTVVCTATDARQRSDSCSFAVVIQTPPKISLTRFVAFGDSITYGEDGRDSASAAQGAPSLPGLIRPQVQFPFAQTYPGGLQIQLQARYVTQNPTVFNAGLRLEKAADTTTASRFSGVIAGGRYESVLIMEGSNDLGDRDSSDIPPAIASLQTMIRTAKGRGVRPYLATVPPMVPGGSRALAWSLVPMLNDQIRGLAASENITLVDVYADFGSSFQQYIGFDGLHPNADGYARIANLFFTTLKSTLETPQGTVTTTGAAIIRRPRR
jgi:lysophospholipase L1-like esterase